MAEAAEQEQFEARLPARVKAIGVARKKRGLEQKQAEEIEEYLREAHTKRSASRRATGPTKRFATWVRSLVVESMKNSIQAMFYAVTIPPNPT